ncbi:TetR/AcrR family transcriptional regulator C-terminal domain-containing protein [Planifilum fimeticola]
MTREGIIDAALSLLNQSGLNRLSMRRLADSLGVQAASLYWHIKNKSELLQLMADKICEEMNWPDEAGMSWREKVRRGMVSYREALLQYRDSAEIFADTPPLTPNRLRMIESLYKTLGQAGLSQEEVVLTADLLNNYVIGFVMEEVRFAGRPGRQEEEKEARPESHPVLPDMEKRFQYGLEIILDGISFRLNREGSSPGQ